VATDHNAVITRGSANFKTPPREYGAIQPFASWNGPDASNGVFVVNVSPGRGEPKYLSPEDMAQMKFAVQEAAKRGTKLWLQDESGSRGRAPGFRSVGSS
jgi:hypothetical protein